MATLRTWNKREMSRKYRTHHFHSGMKIPKGKVVRIAILKDGVLLWEGEVQT